MAWENTNRDHIGLLIQNENWKAAYRALKAYIGEYGEDYWAKNFLKLVEDHLND